MIAGRTPTPVASLDALTRALLAATPEVPYYATTVARARLTKMHEQLAAALRDPLAAPRAGWPGPRQLLQLRLFCLLFPVSDKRHPVVTPLDLLLGKYLAQCPVASPYQAALGLLVGGLALQAARPGGRVVPEAVSFLAAALGAFKPADAGAGAAGKQQQQQQQQGVVSLFAPGCLGFSAEARAAAAAKQPKSSKGGKGKSSSSSNGGGGSGATAAAELPPLQLYPLLSLSPQDAAASSDAFKSRVLGCTLATARAAANAAATHCPNAAPPLLAPLLAAAEALAAEAGALPAAEHAAVAAFCGELRSVIGGATAARAPLLQSFRVKVRAPKEYMPRFEEDFHAKVCAARSARDWVVLFLKGL